MPVQPVVQTARLYRFGPYELDTRQRELRRSGIRLPVQGQPLQILELLLQSPKQLVTREQFRQTLWPGGTFVDFDDSLNTSIRRLRQVLGDDADRPRFIETLSRRGYRFVAEVEAVSEVATLDPSEPARTQSPQTPKARKHVLVVGAAAAIVLLGTLGLVLQKKRPDTAARQIHSIAVLPLENLSHDPELEYFADGMTDALITDLAQISSLKVISRTSVMRYKGTRKPLPDIAKELNVDGIVEGTVIRTPERLRVDAQLIEANSDRHFWARSYERKPGDAVALQTDLARAIANEIQAKLTPQEQARLLRTESVDPQTYELYLRGRYFWNKRTDASLQKSIDYFQQAIQRSPQYAPAYAAIAEAYVVRRDLSPEETFSKAKAAARAALQMDDTLAEAHNALGAILFRYDWDWADAEKEFRRALTLNPNYATAHQWYAQYLRAMGRQDLAIEELRRAEQLDPISLMISGGSGRYGKQYDLMLEHARKQLELYPDDPAPYMSLGRAYALKKMYREAIAAYQKARDLSGEAPTALSGLGYTYGIWGKRTEALRVLGELKGLSKYKYVSPFEIAKVYVGLNEKDQAFDWLQKAVTDHSIPLTQLRTEEELASLRSDPRYRELLNRIGLPQ